MLNSIQKQLLINQLGVNLYIPNDLINIIKNYCFWDTKTYNTIKKMKFKKAKINYLIRKVLLFYNFNYPNNLNYTHTGVVMHTLDDELPKIHIDNDICIKCGNFASSISLSNYSRKIICKCHN